jgi:SAM-dependent methyltransferase
MNTARILRLAATLNRRKLYTNGLAIGEPYHDLPFDDLPLAPWRRDARARARIISFASDVSGVQGVDLGCSIGGVTFALQLSGALMTGVDWSRSDIRFALAVEAEYRTGATFRVADIDGVIWDEMSSGRFRYAVWLSQWMWYVRQVGVQRAVEGLRRLSECVEFLWFEISVGDGLAGSTMAGLGLTSPEDVADLLRERTVYTSVRLFMSDADGMALKRPLYYCSS